MYRGVLIFVHVRRIFIVSVGRRAVVMDAAMLSVLHQRGFFHLTPLGLFTALLLITPAVA
jgi:hypothetical protein